MKTLEYLTARQLTFDEACALTPGSAVYTLRQHAGQLFLTPSTVKNVEVREPFLRDKETKEMFGAAVHVTYRTMFAGESSQTIYSPDVAERRAEYSEHLVPVSERAGILTCDEAGDLSLPLVPVFGAEVRLSIVVPDIDPSEAVQVAREALETAFGEGLIVRAAKGRPASDLRLNVSAAGGRAVVAVNVLESSSWDLMGQHGNAALSVEEVPYGTEAQFLVGPA